jgi:hypothetical protein
VSKFHSIWSTIVQESNLGRKEQILGENHVFQVLPTGQCPALPDNIQRDPDKVRPSVLSSKSPQSDNVRLYRTMSDPAEQCSTDNFSLTFVHDFGHILLTGCPFDLILFSLRS